jgi:hypothetical protein
MYAASVADDEKAPWKSISLNVPVTHVSVKMTFYNV